MLLSLADAVRHTSQSFLPIFPIFEKTHVFFFYPWLAVYFTLIAQTKEKLLTANTEQMSRMKRVSRSDLIDEFLESKGLHRKHIARDATCLFRAVSEQV